MGRIAKSWVVTIWRACIVLLCLCSFSAYGNDEVLTYRYPEQGLTFTARLLREEGRLSAYEFVMTNNGKEAIHLEGLPVVPSEASGIFIYRLHKDSRRELIDQGTVSYPTDGTPVPKVWSGVMRAGESRLIKGTFSELFNAYKGVVGNTSIGRDLTDSKVPRASFDPAGTYDIGFFPAFFATWPKVTDEESDKRSGFVRNDIGFNGRLTFRNVKYDLNGR